MIEHGDVEPDKYVHQLESASVISECECGCASIDFQIGDIKPNLKAGMKIISDYLYGPETPPFGAFVFTCDDILAGLEVYSYTDKPAPLPSVEDLRPIGERKDRTRPLRLSPRSTGLNLMADVRHKFMNTHPETMYYISTAAYLFLFTIFTIVVGRLLHTNGQVFIRHTFDDQSDVPRAVSALLLTGFYMTCLGLALWSVGTKGYARDLEGLIRNTSIRLGICIVTVSIIHTLNVLIIATLFRKKKSA